VVASSEAVDCSESRFWRTDAERTMPVILISFWIYTTNAPPFVHAASSHTVPLTLLIG
jgi:hypothetical protein